VGLDNPVDTQLVIFIDETPYLVYTFSYLEEKEVVAGEEPIFIQPQVHEHAYQR
jgi:hypothetical protein